MGHFPGGNRHTAPFGRSDALAHCTAGDRGGGRYPRVGGAPEAAATEVRVVITHQLVVGNAHRLGLAARDAATLCHTDRALRVQLYAGVVTLPGIPVGALRSCAVVRPR